MGTTKKAPEPKLAEGVKPREKGHRYLEIRRLDGSEIYKRMDVTHRSENEIERIERGALINMDMENWCIEDVKA
jgi:hypothetical protein